MALRSLDNALPTTPELPKKHLKVAISIPIDSAVNNENRVHLPPVASAADSIDYISSENLKPIPDPDSRIQSLIDGLESKDWMKIFDSLNDVRRFALYHSTLLHPILEKVMLILVKAMKNPRSALCKTSIMASSDLFKSYGDTLLESTTSNGVDNMILQLLLKASQDKKFVCEEADRALNTMVGSTTPLPLLQKLKGYVIHGNHRVRARAAVSISHCVSKMDVEGMKEYGLVPLTQMATQLVKDRLPEAREAARGIVLLIHKAVIGTEESEGEGEDDKQKRQEKWQAFCQSNLSAIDALAMAKLVLSL